MTGTPSATYVYCIVRESPRPAPRGNGRPRSTALRLRLPTGLAGAGKPRLVDAGDGYQLVVASAPLSKYDAPVIDAKLRDLDWVGGRAAEHEDVVERASAIGTVVPMKLFTLFASDERALEHVRKIRRSLDRVVERIAGCEEWGLRIILDEARAARASAAGARSAKIVSGKDFLLRKKALEEERRSTGVRGLAEVDELYERVAKAARRAQRRPAPSRELAGRVLLDAVFLIPSAAVKKVKATVTASAQALVESGFDVSLTGPWPAYSFIGGR